MAVAPDLIAMQPKPVAIPMLKSFAPKASQSKLKKFVNFSLALHGHLQWAVGELS
jgi:hypothetical protein